MRSFRSRQRLPPFLLNDFQVTLSRSGALEIRSIVYILAKRNCVWRAGRSGLGTSKADQKRGMVRWWISCASDVIHPGRMVPDQGMTRVFTSCTIPCTNPSLWSLQARVSHSLLPHLGTKASHGKCSETLTRFSDGKQS